jgi:hypothetical protein
VLIAILVASLAAATGLFGALAGRLSAPRVPPPAPSVVVVRPTPDVVTAIRDLAQLASAEYHVERVIDLTEKQQKLFGLVETQDSILLIASGQVVAGVDLKQLGPRDVVANPETRRVEITLPAPRILSSRLDNQRTYVHSRTTDLLATRKEELETRARQEAERSIVEAAKEQGILERAKGNAQRSVEGLLRSLGYEQIRVTVKEPGR